MQNQLKDSNKEAQVKELFEAGAHFGYSKSRRHPSVAGFIFGYKNKTAVLDLEKAVESIDEAAAFVRELSATSKQIVFVGNKKEAGEAIQAAAESINMPYVNERWIGGTLTNFKEIRKRVNRLLDLKEKQATGGLSVYTKKEQGVIGKEIHDLERYFSGIVNMDKLPAAIFVVDAAEEEIAILEARMMKIPVIALTNSDSNIRGIDYPIIANDSARASIKFIADRLATAYREGVSQAKPAETAEADTPKTEVQS
jgi:small subunit ribosomal protein S2